ncbi:MAG: AI-2E family transporter [Clostridiales bacterium]|nr:AI-2E family transporter [Clostridiales bacterium]
MKSKWDNDKITTCIYVVLTAAAIYIVITLLNNISNIWTFASSILHTLFALLSPILIAVIISYLLWIPVRALDKHLKKVFKKSHRGISVLLVCILLILTIISVILLIYFMIGGKLSQVISFQQLFQSIIDYVNNTNFNLDANYIQQQLSNLPLTDAVKESIASYLSQFISWLQSFFFNGMNNLFSSATTLISNVFSTCICIVLSIYLLLDKEYFIDLWNKLFFLCFRNSSIGKHLKNIASTFNETFTSYIRGQLLEAFFVGLLSAIALILLDVDYAVVIGIIAGITNMIPYVGPLIGTVLAAIMALLSGDFLLVLWVVIAMQVVQQIDNNFLQPKIIGESVELHAVFTMVAIIIGGDVGGLLGMLIAVPIFASAKKLISGWYTSHHFEEQRLRCAMSSPSQNCEKEQNKKKTPQKATRSSHTK